MLPALWVKRNWWAKPTLHGFQNLNQSINLQFRSFFRHGQKEAILQIGIPAAQRDARQEAMIPTMLQNPGHIMFFALNDKFLEEGVAKQESGKIMLNLKKLLMMQKKILIQLSH